MWSIYEIIHICTAVVYEVKSDHRSKFFNFTQLEMRSLKKSGLQRDSNSWPPRYRCDALPTELWSHMLGASSIYWVHIFPFSDVMWSIYEIIHIWTAGVDDSEEGSEAMIFFQASSFQLLKLENLLWWSHFTFIYNRSTNMNYFI